MLMAAWVYAAPTQEVPETDIRIPPVPRIDEARLLQEVGLCQVRLSVAEQHAALLTDRLAKAIAENAILKEQLSKK